jgi:hypothetical protein
MMMVERMEVSHLRNYLQHHDTWAHPIRARQALKEKGDSLSDILACAFLRQRCALFVLWGEPDLPRRRRYGQSVVSDCT